MHYKCKSPPSFLGAVMIAQSSPDDTECLTEESDQDDSAFFVSHSVDVYMCKQVDVSV